MPSLTSQLIIALRDQVSGPAKTAAASLKGLDNAVKTGTKGADGAASGLDRLSKAAERLKRASGGKGIGWGESFEAEITRMKLSARELTSITKDFERFRQSLSGKKASAALDSLDGWRTRTIANLRAVRAETERMEAARERAARGWRGGLRFAAGAAGLGGGAYMANRMGRGALRATAGNEREGARDYLAGLTSADTARLKGRSLSLSGQYPSVDTQTMHESLREAAMSMRSIEKAFDIGDVMAKGLVVLQSLKGKDQALEESRKFFKALDTMGKNINPDEVKSLYDGYVKAIGVEGADMNMGDLLLAARRSKSAGPGLSNRFLMTTAPGLMQDMGADRFGTSLGSEVAQIIGDRATKQAKAQQTAFGLRKGGKFIDDRKIMTDPDKYAWENLIPALQKKKIDADDIPGVTKAMNQIFSNQLVSDLFTKMITQRSQYQGKAAQFEKAPGIEGAQALPGKDPWVAFEGMLAQLRNSASLLAEGPLAKSVDLLNSFTGAIASLNATLSDNPKLKERAGLAAAGAGGLAAAATGAVLARKGYRWLMDRPAAAAGAGGAEGAPRVTGGWWRGVGLGAAAGFGSAMNPNQVMNSPDMMAHLDASNARNPARARMQTNVGTRAKAALRKQFDEDRERLGIPTVGERGIGIQGRAGWGEGIWSGGAGPIKHLDMSAEAGAAGDKTGEAFKSHLAGQLSAAMADIQKFVQQATAALSFSASPSITPKFGPLPSSPGASPTGLKTGALDAVKQKQAAIFADENFGVV